MMKAAWTAKFPFVLLLVTTSSLAAGYELDSDWDVPPPPRAGSAADQKDFKELRRWQASRTSEECRIAAAQSFMSAKVLFGPKTGYFDEREFAKLEHLIEELIHTAEKEVKPFKEEYLRPRPYDVDTGLNPCVRKPGGRKAYPSSHAAAGMLAGLVLADLFPARAEELREAGVQIGTNRVLGGVHHPSDVATGQSIAEQIHEALESSREFQRDYAEAKARF